MWPNLQFPTDLVTFTEKILNGKLHFSCNVIWLLSWRPFIAPSFIEEKGDWDDFLKNLSWCQAPNPLTTFDKLMFGFAACGKRKNPVTCWKSNNRNTRKRCEISSTLIIKTPVRSLWRHSGVVNINFEHISYCFLVFLLLTLNK